MAERGHDRRSAAPGRQYKWIALSNTTVGVLVASLNASSLIIALFFSLMVAGLQASVPPAMLAALAGQGGPGPTAAALAQLPPLGYLFAALLGSNPLGSLLGPKILGALPPEQAAALTSHTFFPRLIAGPFHHGLVLVLALAAVMCAIAGLASWLHGGRFVRQEEAYDARSRLEA